MNNFDSDSVAQLDIGPDGIQGAKSPPTRPAGDSPGDGLVVSPDQGPVANIAVAPAQAGSPTRLDGSGSSDPDGSVARYDWDFGDGTSASDAGPAPEHVYAGAGTYAVTLTVTDDAGCSTSQVFTGQTVSCNGGPAARTTQSVTVPVPAHSGGEVVDTLAPLLSRLTVGPAKFVAAPSGPSAAAKKTGTRIKYSVSEGGTTTFTVAKATPGVKSGGHCVKPTKRNRHRRRCTRYVTQRGSFDHADSPGANSLRFTGRLRNRKLKPGRYRLIATPTDTAGNKGKAVRRAFRIIGR